RAEAGHDPRTGRVTLMVHAYLGTDAERVLADAKEPFKRYMRSHLGLLDAFVKSLDVPLPELPGQDLDGIVSYAFERYTRTAALIGTPESCQPLIAQLREADVDEVACLVDWMDTEAALDGLPLLGEMKRLAAKTGPSVRGLKNHLQGLLPEYMSPSTITFIDALPLTPNGKLDRRALPEPHQQAGDAPYEAPRGEVETMLAGVWAEVLRLPLEQIGRHDSFFELGGHSLLAVLLVERMRGHGLDVDMRSLFVSPSLAAMAASTGKVKEISL
ncbi:MAG: phosphopantetheine-binding protein, partial [Rhizobacter sp.]